MEKSDTYYCRPLLRAARDSFDPRSYEDMKSALRIAVDRLRGEKRYDGTPLVVHSIDTGRIVIDDVGLGRNSVIATLLHDVVRLGRITLDEAGALFGPETVSILRGLCNISEVETNTSESQTDNFKELILTYSTDPRVILIKLADRLEVMRVLDMFPEEKRGKKAWESLHIYAQIAHKLGLYSIKSELEDLSLKQTHRDDYDRIVRKLSDTTARREAFLRDFERPVKERLDQQGLVYTIKGRTKSVYSIWRKMKRTGVSFEEVYDLFAVRVVIDCPREQEKQNCWFVYSVVTDFYTPNPDRMRDWISIPKSNGYESLHTTVVTPQGKWVEVQIRTKRMDEVAERGIAAHWRYKGVSQGGLTGGQWLEKLRDLVDNADEAGLMQGKPEGPPSGEIFVFTPVGDLRKLPEGATVLDFAFDIHSRIGTTCTGARINHKNVPIKERLRNGDVVEVLTSKNQKPKPDWLNIVVTGKARQRIKVFLREQEDRESLLGRETLERKIKNWKINLNIEEAVNMLCKHYKARTGTEIYSLIHKNKVDLTEIRNVLTGHAAPAQEAKPRGEARAKHGVDADQALIIDDTLKQISYKLARCCNPIYGDDIFGFVTVSAGITIHRADCPNGQRLRSSYPYRVLTARWREDSAKGTFRATLRIQAEESGGIVNRITELITGELKINIRSMSLNSSGGILSGSINIEVTSTQVVDMVAHNLLRIKGVQKAFRLN